MHHYQEKLPGYFQDTNTIIRILSGNYQDTRRTSLGYGSVVWAAMALRVGVALGASRFRSASSCSSLSISAPFSPSSSSLSCRLFDSTLFSASASPCTDNTGHYREGWASFQRSEKAGEVGSHFNSGLVHFREGIASLSECGGDSLSHKPVSGSVHYREAILCCSL